MEKIFEALKRIRQETCPATYMQDFDKNECCDTIEQALLELKSIKEAKPSEALKCLEFLKQQAIAFEHSELAVKVANENYNTIKQALLKAREEEDIIDYKGTIDNLKRENAELKETLRAVKECVMPLVSIDDECVWDNEGFEYLAPKKEDLELLRKLSKK